MAMYPYSEVLEERMKFLSRFGDEVNMAVRDGGALYVPRRLAPPGNYPDDRVVNPIPAINCKMPPRTEEQAECIAKSVAYLKDGQDHVLEAPTGWGKTYGGSAVAARLGQTTVIVVPKNDLIDEWRNTLLNLIGVPESKIGHIQQSVCDYEGKWFVIASLHSLIIPGKYPPEMWKYFGCVLFDETHRVAAETFQQVCHLFFARYRLGLSATPKRQDGKDPIIKANIGPVLVKGKQVPMKPKVLVKRTGWKIPRFKRWNADKQEYEMVPIPHAPGRMATVYKAMANNAARNKIIAEFVKQAYDKGRRIVVMADTIAHLEALHLFIAGFGIPGEHFGFYVGGKKKELLDQAADKPVVMATYAMTAEGTNYPKWDTLVLATPRTNVKQPIGRVMRWKEGKGTPIILDLQDDEPIFKSFYNSREVQYYSVDAEIVKL